MLDLIKKIPNKLKSYYKTYAINNNVKKFIAFNKLRWPYQKNSNNIILVDLFDWYPFVYIYSYVINILNKKYKLSAKYFYFPLYLAKSLKFKFSIFKIEKIFNSFNVSKGINSLEFQIKEANIKKFEKLFKKIKSKESLSKYKYKNLRIGDLIYDTYLRATFSPTINLENKNLKEIFIKAHIYFDNVEKYFKKNKVKVVIVSHHVYIQYGIIARYSVSKKIPVIMIHYLKAGQENFNLVKLDENCIKDFPYYNYKKEFNKLGSLKQKRALKLGKELITNRVAGKKDFTSIYMNKSTFSSKFILKNFKIKKNINTIIIYSHHFYDSPHRHRHMIFPDFYEYLKFFCKQSLKFNDYQWIIKPHPNDTSSSNYIYDEIIKNYPNVKILPKETSNLEITKIKPKLIITNHSTAGHEFAYLGIPILNTGDNIHIAFDFNYHAKNKKDIIMVLKNLNLLKKINFNKQNIYKFMYMHYLHYFRRYERNKLIGKNYFYTKRILENKKNVENDSKLLEYYIKNDVKISKNVEIYVENFIDKELKLKIN